MECKTAEELLAFIRKSPSCYHVIETICRELKAHGFISLQEGEEWKLAPGGSYYVTRNRSSLLAFRIPQSPLKGFQVMGQPWGFPHFSGESQSGDHCGKAIREAQCGKVWGND